MVLSSSFPRAYYDPGGVTGGNAAYYFVRQLVFAVLGWIWLIVNGTLNFGNYKVEQDSRMIYITCGVINQRQYM